MTSAALVPEVQSLSVNRADVRKILQRVNINKAAGPDNILCPCRVAFCSKIFSSDNDIDINTLISIPVPELFLYMYFIKSALTKDYTTHYGKNL